MSIVSHNQGELISSLLEDLASSNWNDGFSFEVIITLNIPEDEAWLERPFEFPVKVLRNVSPKGFGENHNCAFSASRGRFFAVVNPDIRFVDFSLRPLLNSLASPDVGVCGPVVLSSDKILQDSARQFPSVKRLLLRKLLRQRHPDYAITADTVEVDWLAGMFLLFRSEVYAAIHGFDDRYFMYMEDVEICRYLHQRGFKVIWVTSVGVVHLAARASRRNVRHLGWHLSSMVRYFTASVRE